MEGFKMGKYYVYGAWNPKQEPKNAANALYIGKGTGDRLHADHPNVPDYGKLFHSMFGGLTSLSETEALSKEEEMIGKYKPLHNTNLKE